MIRGFLKGCASVLTATSFFCWEVWSERERRDDVTLRMSSVREVPTSDVTYAVRTEVTYVLLLITKIELFCDVFDVLSSHPYRIIHPRKPRVNLVMQSYII